jgi:hypothetical protein
VNSRIKTYLGLPKRTGKDKEDIEMKDESKVDPFLESIVTDLPLRDLTLSHCVIG